MKRKLISVLIMICVLISMVVPASAESTTAESTGQSGKGQTNEQTSTNLTTKDDGIGRVQISTMPMPKAVKNFITATYTYSGNVLITYKTDKDLKTPGSLHIGVCDDKGKNLKVVYAGVIAPKAKSNGLRYMPFQDNKRVLLGDYVLECTPSIDECKSSKLVPIEYPAELQNDPYTYLRWSEVIIAPDNLHMSWTALRISGAGIGSVAFLGKLERKSNKYIITNSQMISTLQSFTEDPTHPGYLISSVSRAGEVKQFVKGGNAISSIGQLGNSPDSVIQDLDSDHIEQITKTPGYDETTIFSPDEKLGIVMTTRFSKNTDPAIFGFMPRPYSIVLAQALYSYSVSGVRSFRKGNVGPALINIDKSMNQEGYQGINLNTDENWVYYSPMSWHPSGKKAMWLEQKRGTASIRIQIVQLLDYVPEESVPYTTTTDQVTYGIKDMSALNSVKTITGGKIAGKNTGYINYTNMDGLTKYEYFNYSDDGVNFYNGYEQLSKTKSGEYRYEAELKLSGDKKGEMNFRATFSGIYMSTKLLFGKDSDGKPKSYGTVTYNGVTMNIKDLVE